MLCTWGAGRPGWVLPGASLDMDFANGVYFGGPVDSLLTTTRASTGYAATSSGLLVPFLSNIPRNTDLGLLVEQAATNLALQSNTFDTTWVTINGASVTANSVTDPTNANNGWLLASASNFGGIQQTITIVSGTTYTASAFCKAGTTHVVGVQFRDGTSTNIVGVKADLNTGTVTGTEVVGNGVLIASGIISFGNGWYRVWVAGTITSTNGGIAIMDRSNAPINIDIFGAQLEASAFATSYIPTTTVAVTRAADVVTFNSVAPFANGFGAFISVGAIPSFAATTHFLSAASGNRIFYASGNTALDAYNGTTILQANPLSGDLSTGFRGAVRLQTADRALAVNSGTIGTDSNTNGVPATVYIGSLNGTGSQNAYTKRIAIFSTLTNAQIASLAALP